VYILCAIFDRLNGRAIKNGDKENDNIPMRAGDTKEKVSYSLT
jgi:hypothetical protein